MIKQENPLLFSPSKSTVIIKVAFDPPFPISYRTFELDLKQTVQSTLEEIENQLKDYRITMKEGGLYVPEKRMWLNESKLLISYAGLLSTVKRLEFRYKNRIYPDDYVSHPYSSTYIGVFVVLVGLSMGYILRQKGFI